MSIKKVFKGMLDNTIITSSQELKDVIDIIGEVLQAEEGELGRISNFYTSSYIKTKEFYTDISSRYDSENFINVLRDYKNLPKTVNRLIPIHRRRASNNIMKLLTKEYFKGYVIEVKYDEEEQEMILEIYIDTDTEIDKDEVYRVFEKVKNRLLIAGIRKVLRIILRVVDYIIPPAERWIFKIEGMYGAIESPELDLSLKFDPFEEIYFNNVWFTLHRSRLNKDKHRLFSRYSNTNVAIMTESYTYGNGANDNIKNPIYTVTGKTVQDLEISNIGISLLIKTINKDIDVEKPLLYKTSNLIITIKEVSPDEVVESKLSSDGIIIDPSYIINYESYSAHKMNTPLPKEIYNKQESDTERKINVPSNKMSIWYPDTKQLGVGLFVLGKNRLTREYAEYTVE